MSVSLQLLRDLIGDTRYVQKECFSHSLAPAGLPRGAITEVCGPGKTAFTVQFLAEHPELQAAWVEQELSIYPCGFLQRKVSLDRVLFTEAGDNSAWAALQVLRSGLFQIVVLCAPCTDEKILRRLQLASEKSGASLVLLSEKPQSAWPIMHQFQIVKTELEPSLHVTTLRAR